MKTVLITGASSGIGLQLANDYLDNGCRVLACGRDQNKLEKVLHHVNVQYCVFDTQNMTQIESSLESVLQPDLVILNAGNCEYVDDAHQLDARMFDRVFSTNVMGTVNCLSVVLPKMKHGSHLAIVSSSVTFLPLTRAEAYGASKAALDYLTKTLSVDLKDVGIDVSLIRPGFVDTPLTRLNDFPMPGTISVEKASQMIRRGLDKRKLEINFPFIFILILRILSWLPSSWWQVIAVKMRHQSL